MVIKKKCSFIIIPILLIFILIFGCVSPVSNNHSSKKKSSKKKDNSKADIMINLRVLDDDGVFNYSMTKKVAFKVCPVNNMSEVKKLFVEVFNAEDDTSYEIFFKGSTGNNSTIDTVLTVPSYVNNLGIKTPVDSKTDIANIEKGETTIVRSVALSSSVDTDGDGVVDKYDEYPNDPIRAFNMYSMGTLAYEDLWPKMGDYDLNDMVLDYTINSVSNSINNIVELECSYLIQAALAGYKNGFGFQLPITNHLIQNVEGMSISPTSYINLTPNNVEDGQEKAVIIVYDNHKNLSKTDNQITVKVTFTEPINRDVLGAPPFNSFIIADGKRGHEIHLPGQRPTNKADTALFKTFDDITDLTHDVYYKTTGNYVWGLNIPQWWNCPDERININDAYLKYKDWTASNGNTFKDWYKDKTGHINWQKIYLSPYIDKLPDDISLFTAQAISSSQISLQWTNPPKFFAGVMIVRNKDAAITDLPVDKQQYKAGDAIGTGTVIYNGKGTHFEDTGLQTESTYYYTAFSYNSAVKYTTGTSVFDTTKAGNIIYVDASGDDLNDGLTILTPKKTIQGGIDGLLYGGKVLVAAGAYNEEITMKEGVSIYGSYNKDWSVCGNKDRNNPIYKTTINLNTIQTTAITCENGITSATVIDGFIINVDGSGKETSYGIKNNNASPTITNNTINGGAPSISSNGIYNFNSSPQIKYNIIQGGKGTNNSFGIYNSDSSSPVIINNIITGNSAPNSTYGICNKVNSSPVIINNTICGGKGQFSYAIYSKNSPGSIIENNIIFNAGGTLNYGIYEYFNDNPASLRNNNIFDCQVLYHNSDGQDLTNIDHINDLTDTVISSNISTDPNFVNKLGFDWHLQNDSNVNVRAGGLDQSLKLTDDLEGNLRTADYWGKGIVDTNITGAAGWSMGAYEID